MSWPNAIATPGAAETTRLRHETGPTASIREMFCIQVHEERCDGGLVVHCQAPKPALVIRPEHPRSPTGLAHTAARLEDVGIARSG
jgi:hypothetical protein